MQQKSIWVTRICGWCGSEFVALAREVRAGRAKYCGRSCVSIAVSGPKPRPESERFWEKVVCNIATRCWEWTGALQKSGYGWFQRGSARDGTRNPVTAHSWAYKTLIGPIPEGLELDHLCRNRRCCNPAHLEPVTHQVNMSRGAFGAKAHCPKGHPYSGANLHVRPNGNRRCRVCVDRQNDARRLVSR